MLTKLHAKLGDFWWYSLMIFCAWRTADFMNAIVGLWLVPKYINPVELGAVMPLTQFASFLVIPIAAFANTFRNEISRLSINREFGKLKTLMRGVFVGTVIFLLIVVIIAKTILPLFLEQIRIAEGSLGVVIIIASIIGALAPIYSNALQALKKFKELSILSIISAPIRFLTMLIAMPYRALSGYFLGQASNPAFSIIISIFALHKELSVKAEPYWNNNIIRRFSKLFATFAMIGIVDGLFNLVESTTIRQRLPDLDSAGYYIATRFSEIAGFLSATLAFTIFPFSAEKSAKGEDSRPLVVKSLLINACFCTFLALPFIFYGKKILTLLPHIDQYAAYWWTIPWLIGITYLNSIIGIYITSEFSANRFTFLKWYLPLEIAYPILLLIITGHKHLSIIIPATLSNFLVNHNIYSLDTMLMWMTSITVIRVVACLIAMTKRKINTEQTNCKTIML